MCNDDYYFSFTKCENMFYFHYIKLATEDVEVITKANYSLRKVIVEIFKLCVQIKGDQGTVIP